MVENPGRYRPGDSRTRGVDVPVSRFHRNDRTEPVQNFPGSFQQLELPLQAVRRPLTNNRPIRMEKRS